MTKTPNANSFCGKHFKRFGVLLCLQLRWLTNKLPFFSMLKPLWQPCHFLCWKVTELHFWKKLLVLFKDSTGMDFTNHHQIIILSLTNLCCLLSCVQPGNLHRGIRGNYTHQQLQNSLYRTELIHIGVLLQNLVSNNTAKTSSGVWKNNSDFRRMHLDTVIYHVLLRSLYEAAEHQSYLLLPQYNPCVAIDNAKVILTFLRYQGISLCPYYHLLYVRKYRCRSFSKSASDFTSNYVRACQEQD